jgi:hypothetical protein
MKKIIALTAGLMFSLCALAETTVVEFTAKDAYQQDLPWEARAYGPFPEVSGRFAFNDALELTDFAASFGGRTYGLADVGMTQGADQLMYLGAKTSGSDGALAGTDDFLLIWDPLRVAPRSFKYTAAFLPNGSPTYGIWSTSDVSFKASAVPEASSASLMLLGLLSVGAVLGSGKASRKRAA